MHTRQLARSRHAAQRTALARSGPFDQADRGAHGMGKGFEKQVCAGDERSGIAP